METLTNIDTWPAYEALVEAEIRTDNGWEPVLVGCRKGIVVGASPLRATWRGVVLYPPRAGVEYRPAGRAIHFDVSVQDRYAS